MRIQFKGDTGQFLRATNEYEKIQAKALTGAVRKAGKAAQDAGRTAIQSSGLGSYWVKSFRFLMKPKTGDVLNPFAWVHSIINFFDVFQTGKSFGAKKASLLWLPLKNVPMWPGAKPPRQLSPKKYSQIYGPLRTISRPGKAPMLGGVVRAGSSGRPTRKSFGGIRGTRGKLQVVPLFVGVKRVDIANKFDVVNPAIKAADDIEKFYLESLVKAKDIL